MKLYTLFLKSIIPVFDKANILLQSDKPLIHKCYTVLKDLLKQVMLKFVKPSALLSADLLKIRFDLPHIQKSNTDLFVRESAREYMRTLQGLNPEKITVFYQNVRKYYVTACTYMREKFPFQDALYFNAKVADISNRIQAPYSALEYFLDRFPVIEESVMPGVSRDVLQQEYLNVQVDTFSPDLLSKDRIDVQWVEIGKLTDSCHGVVWLRNTKSCQK
jgi:hypothetical protein